MSNQISRVNAKNGGLEFILYNGEILGVFKDPLKIKLIIISNGILDNVAYGSSMDKASDFGFESDNDAQLLFEKSILSQ